MMKKTILLCTALALLLAACFPACPGDARAESAPLADFPAAFDLRSVDTDGDGTGDRCYVTPVRFQNPFATCWAFAGISAAEISLLGSVYADDPEAWKTLDLSEKHLGYFSHMLLDDPASPQNGEGTTAADPTDMFEVYGGGSAIMAAEAFAQGIGPADEHPDLPEVGELFEYHGKDRVTVVDYFDGAFRNFHYSSEDDWTIPERFRFHQDYVLTAAHLLPCPALLPAPEEYAYNEAGTAAIKEQLLQKRGILVNLLADTSTPSSAASKLTKYISEKFAHYTWDFGSSNHVVTLVGWDDNYSRENFLPDHQPPADGAWLAKNSWGSAEESFPSHASGGWGIENGEGLHTGYFWISYYDHSLNDPIALEFAPASPQDLDQHDYFLPFSFSSDATVRPATMANVFRADRSKVLRSVACMMPSPGTSVHYQVYLLQDAYQTPQDGLLAAEGDASFVYAGFHRIPLPGVPVQKGQYFSVLVTLLNAEGTYDIPKSSSYGLGGDVQRVVINERESYLLEDGLWQDYKTLLETWAAEGGRDRIAPGFSYDNFPIKVYSDPAPGNARMKVRLDSQPLSLLEGLDSREISVQFIVNSGFDLGNPTVAWQLLPGSEGILSLSPKDEGSSLTVTAKAPGTALLSATAEGIGTAVVPVTVAPAHLGRAVVVALDPAYTGEEIIPFVLVMSDTGASLTEGVHFQASFENNIRCGLARAVITGIGACADPDAAPIVEYFSIVPAAPEILSLSAEAGELRLSLADQSASGADGYEARCRLKGTDGWTSASFAPGSASLLVSGLAPGEYEVQARAFVDNTDADDAVPEYLRILEFGEYGELRTVAVP